MFKILLILFLCMLIFSCSNHEDALTAGPEILPGFTLIPAPNTNDSPGTVFAVDSLGIPQPLGKISIQTKTGITVLGKVKGAKNSTISALIRFLGAKNFTAESVNELNNKISYNLELSGCTQEHLNLLDIDTALEALKEKIWKFKKLNDLKSYKYYIITEAVKATKLTYTFDTVDTADFHLKANINKIITVNPGVKWENENNYELSFSMDTALYVYAKYFSLKVEKENSGDTKVEIDKPVQAVNPIYIATTGQKPGLLGSFFQQTAGEYRALCFQAYNIAARKIIEVVAHPTANIGNKAVITDIDETILDSSPYSAQRALMDSSYSEESWLAWTSKAECDTIPGAASFLKFAAKNKMEIFYICNRVPEEMQATVKNLQKFDLPYADTSHILLKQTTSGKERRRSFVAQNHEIVLLIGDNLSDFSAIYDRQPADRRNQRVVDNASLFGNKFIIIPNFQYGDWEYALTNYNYYLTPRQLDSIRFSYLKLPK